MALRYFATNRDMENLGRRVERTQRKTLEQGGYYFVDMRPYMEFYLGEVDSGQVPPAALVKSSKTDIYGPGFLGNKRITRVVVCIHGFNVELFEAFTWFRILTETLRHMADYAPRIVTDPDLPEDAAKLAGKAPKGGLTAFIGFSWPSNGRVFDYLSDQRDAQASTAALANLLARLHIAGKSVNLLCHSMGNFVACHTLASLVKGQVVPACFTERWVRDAYPTDPAKLEELETHLQRIERCPDDKMDGETVHRDHYFVDRYVMIAPDVERRHITKARIHGEGEAGDKVYVGPFYTGLQHLVGHCTNVYSRFDSALGISDVEKKPREALLAAGSALSKASFGLLDFLERNPDQKWEKRLGEAPHPPNAPPSFTSINATEVAGRKIDHSDHIDSAEAVRRIARALLD